MICNNTDFFFFAYINELSALDWKEIRYYVTNVYELSILLFKTSLYNKIFFNNMFNNKIVGLIPKINTSKKYFFTNLITKEDLFNLQFEFEHIKFNFFGFYKETIFYSLKLLDNVINWFNIFELWLKISIYSSYFICTYKIILNYFLYIQIFKSYFSIIIINKLIKKNDYF